MNRCPECGERGIFAHSVIASLRAARAPNRSLETVPTFVRCIRCGAAFSAPSPGELVGPLDREWDESDLVLWMRPPWLEDSLTNDFELSWDLAEHFFDKLSREHEHLGTVARFVRQLRDEGYGARLRAGQSLWSLLLSRAREHGLVAGQSYLAFDATAEGALLATGRLAGRDVGVDAGGPFRQRATLALVDELAALPIDA